MKANFNIKKIEGEKRDDKEELESIIERSGVGSHMIFRSKNKDDEFFIDEI
ncbi:hypothetical protein [Nitrosopumilus sp.]|uniref:hypothetical protein n=1 Tax=Nitrosopumilus sp. TaxID=2024843 RepID=UPI003D0E3018